MPRFILGMGFAALLLAAFPAAAGTAPQEEMTGEMVLGSEDAPVTMMEFFSLTCSHCADFHRGYLPRLKKDYIDTGKLKLIVREFPTRPAQLSIAASMIARCAGKKKYFGLIEVMFRSQKKWVQSENPKAELESIARFGGMSKDDVATCLDNDKLFETIKRRAIEGQEKYGVEATPSFFVEGEKIEGAKTFDEALEAITKAIDKVIEQKKQTE